MPPWNGAVAPLAGTGTNGLAALGGGYPAEQLQAVASQGETLRVVQASYVAESATEECRVPLNKEECDAHRTATPAFTDSSGHSIEASTTSMDTLVDDKFLPFGCQWYVDPPRPELNRFLYNEANADARGLFKGHNTLSAQCTERTHWCYPAYSYRVCGDTGSLDTDQRSGGVPLAAAAARAAPAILLVALCLGWLCSGVCKRLCSSRDVAGLIIRPITEEARGNATKPANGDKPSDEILTLTLASRATAAVARATAAVARATAAVATATAAKPKTDPPVTKPLPWLTQNDRLKSAMSLH